jgi:putative endonuclease
LTLDRYYVGSTIIEPEERLERHLEKYYGNTKYTAKADDWELFLEISCFTKEQARNIERHIKRMKSRSYLMNIKRYPNIIDELRVRYQ